MPSRRSPRFESESETSPANLEETERPEPQEQAETEQPLSDEGDRESVASVPSEDNSSSSEDPEDIGDTDRPEDENPDQIGYKT